MQLMKNDKELRADDIASSENWPFISITAAV